MCGSLRLSGIGPGVASQRSSSSIRRSFTASSPPRSPSSLPSRRKSTIIASSGDVYRAMDTRGTRSSPQRPPSKPAVTPARAVMTLSSSSDDITRSQSLSSDKLDLMRQISPYRRSFTLEASSGSSQNVCVYACYVCTRVCVHKHPASCVSAAPCTPNSASSPHAPSSHSPPSSLCRAPPPPPHLATAPLLSTAHAPLKVDHGRCHPPSPSGTYLCVNASFYLGCSCCLLCSRLLCSPLLLMMLCCSHAISVAPQALWMRCSGKPLHFAPKFD